MDRRGMSGKWQAFFVIILVAFGFPLLSAVYPIATRETIADVLGVGLDIWIWLLNGYTGIVLIYGFIAVGLLLAGSAMYLAGEQVVKWYRKRRDGTINEYQIK